MLIEVVTKTHGPRLHRPDHHKSRQGHRVRTAYRCPLLDAGIRAGYTFWATADPGSEGMFSWAVRQVSGRVRDMSGPCQRRCR